MTLAGVEPASFGKQRGLSYSHVSISRPIARKHLNLACVDEVRHMLGSFPSEPMCRAVLRFKATR